MSTVITLRIPKRLKEAMERFADHTDWPEYLRSAIAQKLRQLELTGASQEADRIRAKTVPGAYDSAQTIRRDRGR